MPTLAVTVSSFQVRGRHWVRYLNYINCFPEVTETLTRWSGQLQVVYASPAAYEPASKVTIQSSKTVIDDNANLLVAQTVDGVKEKKKRNDYAYHQLQLVHKEVPAVFLLETRGDVFAEVSANHVPDAATALSKFQAMSAVRGSFRTRRFWA